MTRRDRVALMVIALMIAAVMIQAARLFWVGWTGEWVP